MEALLVSGDAEPLALYDRASGNARYPAWLERGVDVGAWRKGRLVDKDECVVDSEQKLAEAEWL